MHKLAILVLAVLCWQTNDVRANPNACDDYLARHYKKDLVVTGLRFQNRQRSGGRVPIRYQSVALTVKNTGQVGFPLRGSDNNGWRRLNLRVNGVSRSAYIQMPLASGASTVVRFALPAGTLQNCQNASTQIDTNHWVGQWGCAVWNNDDKLIRAYQSGVIGCRILRPPRRPVRPIRPKPPRRGLR